MAVYKIPQDVEADDKFVGPLSFKQFIFAGIASVSAYLCFLSLSKGFWPALIFLLPVIIVTGFLGFPWGRDQPTEIWLAARIRFFIKPRVRIWNQSGIKELVTITVPKKVERHLTNGLSQHEVSSKLTGLADLLDSRGWAVKNANVNMYSGPVNTPTVDEDDRLVAVAPLPQETVDVTPVDDVLDEKVNPTAQHFEKMIQDSEQKHRQEVMQQLQAVRAVRPAALDATDAEYAAKMAPPKEPKQHAGADFWFLQQGAHKGQHQSANQIVDAIAQKQPDQPEAGFTTFQSPNVVAPHTAANVPATVETYTAQRVSSQDEQALLAKIHKDHEVNNNPFGNIRTIQPIQDEPPVIGTTDPVVGGPAQQAQHPFIPPTAPVTPPVDPAIMKLASNDDLNVATIARQAEKKPEHHQSDNEVVVSLR